MAAGKREGKEADTAHITLVGSLDSRRGSGWLGGEGVSLLLTSPARGQEATTVYGRATGRDGSSSGAWPSCRAGNVQTEKANLQAWPDFPRFLPVDLGPFKA